METKQIEVDCPCCRTRLIVDVLTRTVLRADAPAQVDETGKAQLDPGRWDAANERVSDRSRTAEDKFGSALERERAKVDRLDALFDQAKKKLSRRSDDPL